jgi:putative phosphoribosyl transferase
METGIRVGPRERFVEIPVSGGTLGGSLFLPNRAQGVVVFAHGSGSGRLSPRNRFVAESLQIAGLGTLLIDLLTEDEGSLRDKVFDIELLADRLHSVAVWLRDDDDAWGLALGYFGASTGAAAALLAAGRHPEGVRAVVSRGGRPDLASAVLSFVVAPTLLIVGSRDTDVVALNRQAFAGLRCVKDLQLIPGATHLFPEPGALEEVAVQATRWFLRYLREISGAGGVPSPEGQSEPRRRLGDRFPTRDMDYEC